MVNIAQARPYVFTTTPTLELEYTAEDFEAITPGTEVSGSISISYQYDRFSRPQGFLFPRRKQPTTINVSVAKAPTWCTVTLDEHSFNATIDSFLTAGSVNVTTSLLVKVAGDAPAFIKETIELTATSSENGNIQSASTTVVINITAAFVPVLQATLSNTSITLKPDEQHTITLLVENKGNAEMSVAVSTVEEFQEYYTITLPQTQRISVGGRREFVITIQANSSQEADHTSMQLFSITSHATADIESKGPVREVSVSIITLQEKIDDEEILDLSYYLVAFFVIFIIVILIASLIVRRRR